MHCGCPWTDSITSKIPNLVKVKLRPPGLPSFVRSNSANVYGRGTAEGSVSAGALECSSLQVSVLLMTCSHVMPSVTLRGRYYHHSVDGEPEFREWSFAQGHIVLCW